MDKAPMNATQPGNGIDRRIELLLPDFGYAVDVGANNGIFLSNTKRFEDKGWYVLCAEPHPLLAEEGRKNRKLWRQVACGKIDSQSVTFLAVGEYPWASGSGFHPEQFVGLARKEFTVPMRRLDTLISEVGFPRLDLLSIDAEWHEMDVLYGITLDYWKPTIIVAESLDKAITEKMDAHLFANGYEFLFVQELDRCYRRKA